MFTIDAHQHFWKYHPQKHDWIGDDMASIRKDFFPQDLHPILKDNDVDGTVAVQAEQTEEETHFLLDLCEKNSFIFGVVGWVDLQSPLIGERLEYFSQFAALKGFRHVLQGEKQRDLFLQKDFLAGLGMLEQYNFTYDLLILPDQLQYLPELLKALPNQRFVIDHLAKPMISTGEIAQWKTEIEKAAEYENVYCKVSGMVTEANPGNWTFDNFAPYLDVVADAFGVKRLMYGSDWPVCTAEADYTTVINLIRTYFNTLSVTEQEQIFAGTAKDFYTL